MIGRPSLIDFEEAKSRLPTAQNDQSRVALELVNRAMHMAKENQIGCAADCRCIFPEDSQMPFLVGKELAIVVFCENVVQETGWDGGDQPKGPEEEAAFQK